MLDGVISTNYEGNPTMKNATLTRKTTNAKCMVCGKTRKEQLRELPTFNTAEDNDGNIVQVTLQPGQGEFRYRNQNGFIRTRKDYSSYYDKEAKCRRLPHLVDVVTIVWVCEGHS